MSRPEPRLRVSFGYDSHKTAEGRPLILAGVAFAGFPGLAGHSDADVITHAVIDALVSGSRLGDIGRMFPDDDERFAEADSIKLLEKASTLSRYKGYRVVNCDCTLIAERPKIAALSPDMERNIASALGIPADMITVKGKTNEGLDSIGKGEAMAAYAVMLLEIPA